MTQARFALVTSESLTQEIRKSKFIANAACVVSPEAAMTFINEIRDASATHNCWAYRIDQQYRFSDDGEPGGTAGKPILQAIDAQHCDNTVVVVTRWYGGIKLGAGGLARAYGGCAAECLRLAPKIELIKRATVEFALAFSQLPALYARLAEFSANKLDERFAGDGATLRLALPSARVEALRAMLADLSRGRCEMRLVD